MKKCFVIQYIDDITKKLITTNVSASDHWEAAISLADRLGYPPIILEIKVVRSSKTDVKNV